MEKKMKQNHKPPAFRKPAAYFFITVLLLGMLLPGCSFRQNASPLPEISGIAQQMTGQGENTARLPDEPKDRKEAQEQFDRLADQVFREAVTDSYLDQHYTVTDPAAYGLEKPKSLYGELSLQSLKEETAFDREILSKLKEIPRDQLTMQGQLDYDVLESYLETELLAEGLEAYVQPLAPTIGIQAQLPILLAEYVLYTTEDVEDYLELVEGLDGYFGQILAFEKEKADQGLLGNDQALERIIESCRPYLEPAENCVLTGSFSQRLDGVEGLSGQQKEAYQKRHDELVASAFIPAYQHLIDGLENLKGAGTVEGGLCNYPKGKEYYRYLVYSSTATSCKSVDTLRETIKKRIEDNFEEAGKLVRQTPDLIDQISSYSFSLTDPVEILTYLQEAIKEDYPEPICKDYALHYVPEVLEPVLSPAFYLTPPIDRASSNPIYINRGSSAGTDSLFPTLAHEGYPGHLYQSAYFAAGSPSPLRYVLSFGSYAEGWATYVEYESYYMDPGISEEAARFLTLNEAINLGIHAYVDIMVNDQGWKVPEISEFISQYYDDSNQRFSNALYEAMVDNPANFLEYYAGYLEFSDMREKAEKALGKSFTLKEFHQFILDIGPAPFTVIRERLDDWVKERK